MPMSPASAAIWHNQRLACMARSSGSPVELRGFEPLTSCMPSNFPAPVPVGTSRTGSPPPARTIRVGRAESEESAVRWLPFLAPDAPLLELAMST
jgi:hypothetical protein